MSDNKENDSSLIVILVVCVAVIGFIINNYSSYFYEGWRWLRLAQLYVFYWIPDSLPILGETREIITSLREVPTGNLNKTVANSIDSIYYPIFGWIPVAILIYLGLKNEKKTEGVFEKLSMEGILKKYSISFPFLKPYVDYNPGKMEDLTFERDNEEKLKYLPAMQPVEYATMVPPLFLEKEAKLDSSLMAPIWSPDDSIGFDEDLAEKAFKKQLGRHYEGVESLNSTEKRIYDFLVNKVSFNKAEMQKLIKDMATKICNSKGEESDSYGYSGAKLRLLNELKSIYNNISSENKKKRAKQKDPNIIKHDKYINKLTYSKKLEPVLKAITGESIMRSHAYIYCGLMTMLEAGREGGVIPPVEFQWIKLEDRTLYFCLTSVGKKVSFVESSGPFAHWLLEKHIERAIPTPEVSEAVAGLKVALYIDEKTKSRN